MKKRVFVSFDYDNDKQYKFLLQAWDANPQFDFVFDDRTPGEINTNDVGRIKAGLTRQINEATHTLFLVGRYANTPHRLRYQIGFDNWINFEACQSIQSNNYLAVIKLETTVSVPSQLELAPYHYWWRDGFNEQNAISILNESEQR